MSSMAGRPTKLFFVAAGLASASILIASTSTRAAVTSTNTVPASFLSSPTVKSLVNPRNHVAFEDTRSSIIRVKQGVSDEVILAKYLKGFFGGWIFTPERRLFMAIRPDAVRYSKLDKVEIPQRIWSAQEISSQTLPPLYTTLFGAFQVVEARIHDSDPSLNSGTARRSHSYIDIAYGSDTTGFSGAHRFSVYRNLSSPSNVSAEGSQDSDLIEEVEIEFPSYNCNPTVNKNFVPQWMAPLHKFYAMLLFKEAIKGVLSS